MPVRTLIRLGIFWLATAGYCAAAMAEQCEPAVDMMESNDAVNRIGECDYSDEGLTGWLKGRGADEGENAPEPSRAAPSSTPAGAVTPAVQAGAFTLSRPGVKTALELLQARFDLAAQAAQRCEREAVLSQESYIPEGPGSTKLNMKFYCR